MFKYYTVNEYAKIRGVSTASVRLALARGTILPGLIDATKPGRDWVLKINEKKLQKSLEVTLA